MAVKRNDKKTCVFFSSISISSYCPFFAHTHLLSQSFTVTPVDFTGFTTVEYAKHCVLHFFSQYHVFLDWLSIEARLFNFCNSI